VTNDRDSSRKLGPDDRSLAELSGEGKSSFERILGSLPDDFAGWRKLIDEATDQLRQVVGDKSAVAIIGPANAGKSTLYNRLIQDGQQVAAVSALPGTTRQAQQADAGIFSIIDTPGADAAGALGEREKERALAAARGADVLVVLFDASHGIRGPEVRMMDEISGLAKPTLVALNKMDLVSKGEKKQVVNQAAERLGLAADRVVPVSAKQGQGLGELLVGVAQAEPAILAALGAALPAYRRRLVQAVITRAASTAAAIAITPLPFIDFVPLLGVQAAMVLSVARIYDYKLTLARARELLVTFGAGLLGRTLFYELSKLGGPPGWLISAGVAAGTTAALGYASAVWFDRGTKLSSQALGQMGRAISRSVVDRLRDIGRKRPDRQSLQQRIEGILEEASESELEIPSDGSPGGMEET
jgi:GTP-binding protein Era